MRSCASEPGTSPADGARSTVTHAVEQLVGVLLKAVAELGLTVPTRDLPHRLEGLLTIDHIAVGHAESVRTVDRHVPFIDCRHLSDHDAYVLRLA